MWLQKDLRKDVTPGKNHNRRPTSMKWTITLARLAKLVNNHFDLKLSIASTSSTDTIAIVRLRFNATTRI